MSYNEILIDAEKQYVLKVLENGDEELHFRNKPMGPLLKTLNKMGFVDHPDNAYALIRRLSGKGENGGMSE